MFAKLSTAAVVLAAAQLVSAQTSTECNPMEKKCPDNKALGGTLEVDFSKGLGDDFYEFDGTKLDFDDKGAVFTINKETDAPTIGSNFYIFFGRVDVTLQASVGTGVVTSFVLQSDDLDEIDWEWLGGDLTQVQSNYFGKGDTSTYDRGGFHNVDQPQTTTHTYTLDWTKDRLQWIIDGNTVRELKYADAKGGSQYPQTPMQLRLGTWVAGSSTAPEGTVEWAGGRTDFSQAPFLAHYQSIKVTDYSNGVKGATKYVWDDGSDGSYQSIQVITGGEDSDDGDDDKASTSSEKPTATSSQASSTAESKTESKAESKTASATATASGSASASATSGESTPTATGDATATGGDETSETDAPSTTDIPVTDAAFKTGSSAIVLGAGLFVAGLFF